MANTTEKRQNRVMGEYSIAKSFKGILRISHILELIEGDSNEFSDDFLNSSYFGNPTELMNISGGSFVSKEYGYQTAIKGMEGGIKRYTSSNPRIGNDPLKINRVPMTDSMGNYLNWNIGIDGITIGSNPDINGNELTYDKFNQRENENVDIYQPLLFPILKSNEIVVGLEKMLLYGDKTGVNSSTTSVETGTKPAMLIVENLYDKTDTNSDSSTYYTKNNKDETIQVTTRKYKPIVGEDKTYKKLRTIYNSSKAYPEEFDVYMYRQNDYDLNNWAGKTFTITSDNKWNTSLPQYNEGDILDTTVDITNLKEYVKTLIAKYMKGNTVEVPSGAVIWQYCSLEKWRADGENGTAEKLGDGGYPGHRPSLQQKENKDNNPFFTSTIQGASRKQNKLSKSIIGASTSNDSTKETSSSIADNDSMTLNDDSGLYKEIIPLYKRDYLLCDGSKYRIPYYPPLKNTNLLTLKAHKDRFFELFFNIGYRYTDRNSLMNRPLVKQSDDGIIKLLNKNAGKHNGVTVNVGDEIESGHIVYAVPDTNIYDNIDNLLEIPPFDNWDNLGVPQMVHPSEDKYYKNCDDLDVLFGEDLATMLACDEVYKLVVSKKSNDKKTLSKKEIRQILSNTKLPEEYIFNTFIGDTPSDLQNYANASKASSQIQDYSVMDFTYNQCLNTTIKPKLLLGREVTTFGSYIKFYCNDPDDQGYKMVKVIDLPMVNYFIDIMTSTNYYDGAIQMYCYSFYNYDFQVPNFLAQDKTPVLIGSGAYGEDDENRHKIKKVQSWSSTLGDADYPHRHLIFKSFTGDKSYTNIAGYTIFKGGNPSSSTVISAISYNTGSVPTYYGGKHGWGHTRTDNSGNYTFNPQIVKLESETGKTFLPPLVIQISDAESTTFWKTGKYRTGKPTNWDTTVNFTRNDGDLMKNYYDKLKNNGGESYAYSMFHWEDPRFENAEPNRGITTSPKPSSNATEIINYKSQEANSVFYDAESSNWFTPENITMLPLIKI